LPKVIRWKRQWGGSDIVVWVIRKVDDAWRSDPIPGYYVPRGKCVRHRFGDWLRKYSDSEKAWMPHLGYIGYKHFTDGRHRFAWCRDHGVRAMPVTVETRKQARMQSALKSR
jgi:hypothetical protein